MYCNTNARTNRTRVFGKKLLQQHWCLSVQQHQFNLIEVVQKAQQFNFTLPQFQQTTTNQLIPQLVESLLK
jgi:hypothetical protein